MCFQCDFPFILTQITLLPRIIFLLVSSPRQPVSLLQFSRWGILYDGDCLCLWPKSSGSLVINVHHLIHGSCLCLAFQHRINLFLLGNKKQYHITHWLQREDVSGAPVIIFLHPQIYLAHLGFWKIEKRRL